jgi:hypothetical protein
MQLHTTRKAARRSLPPRARGASVALDDEDGDDDDDDDDDEEEDLPEDVDVDIDDEGSETGPSKRRGSRTNIYETDGSASAVSPRCKYFPRYVLPT